MPAKSARGKHSPPAPPAATLLADRLHSAAIHLLRRLRREDDAAGLPAPQLSALSVIVFGGGPVTLGQLAAAEQVRPPTITKLVVAMEQAGLVERKADPDDGRVVRITATARGTRVLHDGRQRRVATLAATLAGLPASERATLAAAIPILEQVARGP